MSTETDAPEQTPGPAEVEAVTDAGITHEAVVEALLFSTDSALPAGKIAQLLGVGDGNDVKRYIDVLNERYEQCGASFRIQPIAKGYRMHTLPAYDAWVGKLVKSRAESRLSTAALETLAIVAYKQPVMRADVEAIRGVAVGDMLVRLRDMKLVKIAGRAEEIGRPLLYGTTKRFLEVFGLKSLADLPKIDEQNATGVPPLKPAKGACQTATPQPEPDAAPDNAAEGDT